MQDKIPFKILVQAARPKTLPLSFACILMGLNISFLINGKLNWIVAIMSVLTCFLLQILSNFANDLGDAVNGADTDKRIGPERVVQSGKISITKMGKIVRNLIVMCLLSGILLLISAYSIIHLIGLIILFIIGISGILAAKYYTGGKNPYGYKALGDISVFIFFGLIGVLGPMYLQLGYFPMEYRLYFPAIAMGLLSTGVLNINNMRDIETDKETGKITIPVILGRPKAKIYHYSLVISSVILLSVFSFMTNLKFWYFPLIIGGCLLFLHVIKISKAKEAKDFIPFLKQLAIFTLINSVLLTITIIIG